MKCNTELFPLQKIKIKLDCRNLDLASSPSPVPVGTPLDHILPVKKRQGKKILIFSATLSSA
jgi:hypothetical protein